MSVPPVGPPPVDRQAITPTVGDVALLLRTRTVGYQPTGQLGGDTGPSDVTTFSATTRPTDTEAAAMVEVAVDETLGRLPERVDVRLYPAVSRAVAARAAQLIELSFFKESSTDPAAFQASMSALAAAVPGDVAVAYGLSSREAAVWDPWVLPAP